MDIKNSINDLQSGISDLASNEDWLGMEGYYTGISKFIERCEAPMTIAVQGDWGVGKTTAMINVQKKLKADMKNPCMWFKTWQFSVLGSGGNILIEFMLTLLDKLEEMLRLICVANYLCAMTPKTFKRGKTDYFKNINDIITEAPWNTDKLLKSVKNLWKNKDKECAENNEIKRLTDIFMKEYSIPVKEGGALNDSDKGNISIWEKQLHNVAKRKEELLRFGINLSASALSAFAGFLPGALAIPTNALIEQGKDKALDAADRNAKEDNALQSVNKSQTLFLISISNDIALVIKDILKYYDENEKNKLCIFVDDLDRLQPSVALELLEGFKNFVEFESCVFVLAVEEDVIYQGLQSKYDKSFLLEKTQDDNRTRQEKYFDKIIQVPFEIPKKRYNLKEYMAHLLSAKNLKIEKEPDSAVPSVADYADVLKKLKVYNPRSIKRCHNLQVFYDSLSETIPNLKEDASVEKHKNWYDLCSFAVTVIQLEKPDVYNAIMELSEGRIESLEENENNESGNIDDFWISLQEKANEPERTDINVIISCFENVKEKTGVEARNWLHRILALSNYDDAFNKKRIYFKKFKKIIEMLEADNYSGLDFSEFKERFDNLLEYDSKDFGNKLETKNESLSFVMGWGDKKERPYISIAVKNDIEKYVNFSALEGFVPYNFGTTFSKNDRKTYYVYEPSKRKHIGLYVSGESEISEGLKIFFRKIGLLSEKAGE